MIGERVAVLTRREAGEDAMGEPVWEWSHEEVPNCLVRPLTPSEAADAKGPDGTEPRYAVAFPKAYAGELAHRRVALVDRGMDPEDAEGAYRVVGSPDRTRPCPTAWDVVATVGRADG